MNNYFSKGFSISQDQLMMAQSTQRCYIKYLPLKLINLLSVKLPHDIFIDFIL